MVLTPSKVAGPTPENTEYLLAHFDPCMIVPLESEPSATPAFRAELLSSMRMRGQKLPGFVCPSPDLDQAQRICIEGNNRLWACVQLGLPFWAFDVGRFVDEAERIELTFLHNRTRRVMSREELATKAARYMTLKMCSAEVASKALDVSPATLSRAFGEGRICPEFRERADLLGLGIRSSIAALPRALQAESLAYAETPGPEGRKPTRDQVDTFNRELKKGGRGKVSKPTTLALEVNGRLITFTVTATDSASTVAEDMKATIKEISARLKQAKNSPAAWPGLFQ